jgi:hypothetical protein
MYYYIYLIFIVTTPLSFIMEFAAAVAAMEEDNIWVASSDGNIARVKGKRIQDLL